MKTVVEITKEQIPIISVRDYEYLPRDHRWFLVDGELYFQRAVNSYSNNGEELLQHYTTEFFGERLAHGIFPIVRETGEHLCECIYTDDYETSIRFPSDGKLFTVHTG